MSFKSTTNLKTNPNAPKDLYDSCSTYKPRAIKWRGKMIEKGNLIPSLNYTYWIVVINGYTKGTRMVTFNKYLTKKLKTKRDT